MSVITREQAHEAATAMREQARIAARNGVAEITVDAQALMWLLDEAAGAYELVDEAYGPWRGRDWEVRAGTLLGSDE